MIYGHIPADPLAGLGPATIIQGDARALPLPDESVDLVVSSPPYFALRAYTDDNGEVYDGQIGLEESPFEFLDQLVACTREMARVLKPHGSIMIDLGDKYCSPGGHTDNTASTRLEGRANLRNQGRPDRSTCGHGIPAKSLMMLPARYAIRCIDELGLLVREQVVWQKASPLPESVRDRLRREHEEWFHLTRRGQYFAGIDEIREPYAPETADRYAAGYNDRAIDDQRLSVNAKLGGDQYDENPLGKLPGSVQRVPAYPLKLPHWLEVEHYAAFPPWWPSFWIRGFAPTGICLECGTPRFPVVASELVGVYHDGAPKQTRYGQAVRDLGVHRRTGKNRDKVFGSTSATINGYACACTPYTDHPAQERPTTRRDYSPGPRGNNAQGTYHEAGEYERIGPRREYHLDGWTPPPTRRAIVLDPFGGTGTTALAARALGRHGISVDLSAAYCRAARWRVQDVGELAGVRGLPNHRERTRRAIATGPANGHEQGSLLDFLEA